MRTILNLFITTALLLMVTGLLQAETIIVGCDKNFKPFVFKDKAGKYSGFDIDVWDVIAKDLGLKYELMPMEFTQLIPALQKKKIDVAIAGMSITSEREKIIDFSYPYYDSGLLVMVRINDKKIKSIGDLDDKVVGTKKGTTSAVFIRNIQTKEVKLFASIDEAYAKLNSGAVDAVIFDSPNVLHYIMTEGKNNVKSVGRLYKRQSYGFAFPQRSDLREKVSIAILNLKEGLRYSVIYRKWFGLLPD